MRNRLPFFPLQHSTVVFSLVVQPGVAVLLLDRVNGRSLAGLDGAGLAEMLPSCCSGGGESWAAPLAVQTQMCADLRRPEAPHLAHRSHLVQLHRGLLVPGGNRQLLYSGELK